MMKIFNIKNAVIISLFVFVIASKGDICNNDVIECYNTTTEVTCTIYQNNTEAIGQAISFCSAGSFTYLEIIFERELQYTTTIITLNVADNIQKILMRKYYSGAIQTINLVTNHTHLNVLDLRFFGELSINISDNFFFNFPNLAGIIFLFSNLNMIPEFSRLKKLTYLSLRLNDPPTSNVTMDKEWVGGLSKLLYMELSSCGIQSITSDAFSNLHSLTYLGLSNNNLLELTPGVFKDLTELKHLYIKVNNYDIMVSNDANNHNAFSPLRKLITLSLSNSKIIPFDSFTTLSSIETLSLPIASSGIISSTPIQHLHELTILSFFGTSLVCNCSMQWASIVGKFGIFIRSLFGECKNREEIVDDASLYTECELTESYQCFNKSISCDTCINTLDSYICSSCREGYQLTSDRKSCQSVNYAVNYNPNGPLIGVIFLLIIIISFL